jgi:hypothetical protein
MVEFLKIREKVWYEGIVSVLAGEQPYFTPLGFQLVNGVVKLKVYSSAKTSSLLTTHPEAVLNITDDPYLFFLSTFKEHTGGIPKDEVEFINGYPVLRKAYGYVMMKRRKFSPQGEVLLFDYNIEKIMDNPLHRGNIEPYSRCRAFLIEMIIYASKIRDVSIKEGAGDLLNRFEKSLDYSYEIVIKTCMDQAELGIANKLKEMVSGWLRK